MIKQKITLFFLSNIRWKIFLSITLVILLSVTIIGTISYHYAHSIETRNWQFRQEEITHHAVALLDTHFENIYQYLNQIASLPADRDIYNSAYLKNILVNSPYFYEIVLVNPSGQVISTAWLDSPLMTNSFTISQSNWFLQAKSGMRYTGDLQIDSSGQSYIIIAQPTLSGEILAVRIQGSFFQSIVKSIQFGETGKISILNEKGEVIANNNYQYVLSKKLIPEVSLSQNFLTQPDETLYGNFANIAGQNVIVSAQRMKTNQWLVITTVEIGEINQASVAQLSVYLLGFSVLSIIVIVIIFVMLNHSIFNPLKILKEGTDLIADGAYYFQIPITREDEFGRVAQSFNHMTQNIRQRDKSLVEEIQSRERITQALKISQERYELAAKGSNDGIWDWNLKEQKVHYSVRWKSLLGFEEGEIGTSPQEWLDRIHPEDKKAVQSQLEQHLNGKSPFFRSDFRIKTKQNQYIWVSYRALMEVDAEGTPYRIAGSQTDITSQKEFEEKLHLAAYHDSLTGLPNRQYLTENLKQLLHQTIHSNEAAFAVMFLDLDRFKIINDSFGHMKGDQLLQMVANLLREWIRPGDFVSRFGGDEFIIVMQHIDDPEQIIQEIELLHERLNRPFMLDDKPVYVGVSIGVAVGPGHYQFPDEIIRDADIALYQAKNLGLSHYVIFDPNMRQMTLDFLSIETNIRQALKNAEFVLHYQPVIHLPSMTLSGFEALIRWEHPKLGLIPPDSFIMIAEQTGLINQIGAWVIDEALQQLNDWQKINPKLTLSINLSAKQINDVNLIHTIRKNLETHQIDARKLALEITEGSVLEFDENTIQTLHQIKETGIRFYLDDFGTGYSSLNVLHKYPIDTIKIDQTFIREILGDRNKTEIAHTIIQLGSSLGLDVVAEGIENQESLNLLNNFQCPYGQGYYFSKPLPAEKIKKIITYKPDEWSQIEF